ncbi:hypothetical protein DVH26_18685 [Paenibacillus sp. H1-7]|uniref:hypothetical protein n=1 Tax=Paenibacillus sp. H1-7 TaxID=2282849 RepID=UPI001EF8C4A8|nr:hypothetical protein [Paenibacillus sp. H1-7]ULL16294.1 hypothetical protein DVH26_18685 [Paenibacillus sp. H1-7]
MLNDSLGKLARYPLLAIIPIAIDALSVIMGTAMNGFHGNPHFTFKLVLQMGLPSVAAVTEQTFMPGSVQVVGAGSVNLPSILGILMYLGIFIAVQSFLQGGYVGLLYDSTDGRRLDSRRFIQYGGRFFLRFLLLNVSVLLILLVIGGIAAFLLRTPGIILFMILFLWLRVLFLFLEYTIVADDCSILDAIARSYEHFQQRTPLTIPLVIAALLINVAAGLIINALWLPLFFIVLLVLYDTIGAGLQIAFMNEFRRIRG